MPSATPWIQRLWDEVEFSSRESSKIQESAVDKVRDEVTRGIRSFLLNSIKSVPTIILLRIQRSKPRLEHRSRTLSHSDNVSRSEWGSHMPVRRYSIFPIRFLLESLLLQSAILSSARHRVRFRGQSLLFPLGGIATTLL